MANLTKVQIGWACGTCHRFLEGVARYYPDPSTWDQSKTRATCGAHGHELRNNAVPVFIELEG